MPFWIYSVLWLNICDYELAYFKTWTHLVSLFSEMQTRQAGLLHRACNWAAGSAGTLVGEHWAVGPAAEVQAGGQEHSHSGKGPGNGVGQNRPWKLKTKILRPESREKEKQARRNKRFTLSLLHSRVYLVATRQEAPLQILTFSLFWCFIAENAHVFLSPQRSLSCSWQPPKKPLEVEEVWRFLEIISDHKANPVKNLPAMPETQVRSLGQEDPLEKGMATHSSILAWRIPGTEEPGRLPSMELQRVGHNWATNTFTFAPSTPGAGTFFPPSVLGTNYLFY